MGAMPSRTKLGAPLVVWTLVVWTSRLRNIWTDDDLAVGGQVLRTVFAITFLGLAVSTAVRLWRRRGHTLVPGDRALVGAFVGWTVGFWLVRGVGIIVDDHDTAFTAVHTGLMVVSIGLALNAARLLTAGSGSISSPAVPAR